MTNLKALIKSIILSSFLFFVASGSSLADTENYSPLDSPDFFEGLNTFTAVYSHIKQLYVDEIDDETMFKNAIKGMVEGLDPHSIFLDPEDQSDLSESTMGRFGGLGIVIGTEGSFIEIISPIDDTPAYRAGLQAGDIILKIDDQNVNQINLEEGVKLMRGAPGTKVKLTIGRPDIAPFVVEITREIITIVSAKGLLLDEGIGYIRISQFQNPTAKLVKDMISELVTDNNKKLDSLILDLRNNPGGLLNSSIDVANLFIDREGIVVYTEGRTPNSKVTFPTKQGDILNGAPIVVLMNKGSASASEIVAGALQDHKRAIIMGQESFGKGSVQSMLSLEDGFGLKLTTARYYTPSGKSIQAKGIVPDVYLEDNTLSSFEDAINLSSQEKDLKNHLSAESPSELSEEDILEMQDEITENRDKEYIDLLREDYFVHEAINVLKALKVLTNK
jgi:carboxyl-terminal processing protease